MSQFIQNYNKKLESLVQKLDENISLLPEMSDIDVELPNSFTKEKLCQNIWNEDVLKQEVREGLLKIAHEFEKTLELGKPSVSIRLLGSMANYNWNPSSDIDLHLFFDVQKINRDTKLATQYLESKGKEWKDKHENITIKGFPVEVYAQDVSDIYYSKGAYDLIKDEWITEPSRDNVSVDKELLRKKILSLGNQIENLEDATDLQPEILYNKAKKLKDKIKKLRQSGLEEDGEFSVENLTFKYLRNNGYLSRLMNIINREFDEKLTVHENDMLNESMQQKPKHKLILRKSVGTLGSDKIKLIKKFIAECCETLDIHESCTVNLTHERDGKRIVTTASYSPVDDEIWVYIKGRALMDYLRSIAHEIRHFKQKLDGELDENSGETGSVCENQANSFSGVMMREFGKKNPEIFRQ